MTDISNKTLAVFIVISIIVSFLGIIIVKNGATVLGAATNITTGTANVTIQAITQITLLNNTVDFGTGFVNGSAHNCTLFSNSSTKTEACQGFNAPAISEYFVIENNGNFAVQLDINGTYPTARDFLCNSTVAGQNCTFASPEYNFSVDNFESGSCTSASDFGTFFGKGFIRRLNTSTQRLCTTMDFAAASNSIKVPILLVIPRDSIQAARTDSVLFTATSS